ncbi:autorepressor SdpR family transcription factor [Anaeromicrobium sediminis]|uniref:Transcriptional regulator n=1 Tax=Anaeromicrobium sediminis TaxID=1478221 RepID=A0A267MLJ4_9FIRM|nr:autorepressor SdpR family transcription factor [Anaeromicrobium sediminis]PAB60461.1 transcriptional regulator [Anaeromicrobium sediminis]
MNKTFKALSDPTRRKILELLRDKDMTAGEIADYFHISKPSISHHLSTLKNADLILGDKQGQNIYYSLNSTVLQEITKWFFDFRERNDENETK